MRDYALLCLALALVLGTGLFTYAEYVKSSHTSRVVASYLKSQDPFSSNGYLDKVLETEGNVPRYNVQTITAAGEEATFTVDIYNYPRGLEALHYDRTIDYTLTAKLMYESAPGVWRDATAGDFTGATANTAVTLTFNNDTPVTFNAVASALSHYFSGRLPGGRASSDSLKVRFSGLPATGEIPFYLELIAMPDQSGGYPAGIQKGLEGLIGVTRMAAAAAPSWTGSMVETNQSNNPTPTGYDGFNYVISGSGAGTVTLTWDPAKLTLSEASKQFTLSGVTYQYSESGTPASASLVIPVNSDTCPRYELQFYKADGFTSGAAVGFGFATP